MSGTRLWTLALGAAVALSGTSAISSAQTTKADAAKAARAKAAPATADPNAADTKGNGPGGILADPSVQLRMLRMMMGVGGGPGGGGGRGGFGGMGGGITGLLLQAPALQEEIKLTEAQKTALKKVSDDAGKKRTTMFTEMRANAGGNGGGRGNVDRQAMMDAMAEIGQMTDQVIEKILNKAQKARLNQIALQIEGIPALGRPEVAEKVMFDETQLEQVQGILEEMRTAQGESMQKVFASFGGRGGPGGRPGGQQAPAADAAVVTPTKTDIAKAEAAKADAEKAATAAEEAGVAPKAAPGKGPTGGRGGNRPDLTTPEGQAATRVRTEGMAQANKEVQSTEAKAETMIAKIMTKGQKANYKRLLGAKYDLAKLVVQGGRGGGPGGPGGGPGGPGGGPGGPAGGAGGRGNRGGAPGAAPAVDPRLGNAGGAPKTAPDDGNQ